MKQLTLAAVEFERYAKTTRRAAFLAPSIYRLASPQAALTAAGQIRIPVPPLTLGYASSVRVLHRGVHASTELIFPNDALVAVNLAFNAILERFSLFREQANDLEQLASGILLAPIRRKPDRLANCKLVSCHRTSNHLVSLAYACGALDWLVARVPEQCELIAATLDRSA